MHVKLNNTFFALVSILLFVACNGQLKEAPNDSTIADTGVTDNTKLPTDDNRIKTIDADTLSSASRQFIDATVNDINLQINLSNTAIQKSKREEIKHLGKTIVDQQTELFNKLQNITTNKNLEISANKNQSIQDATNILSAKSEKDFDTTYLNWVVQYSKTTIQHFENTGSNLIDEGLRKYAVTSIPIIKQHHDAAAALKNKM